MHGRQAGAPRRPQRFAITAATVAGTVMVAAACGAIPGPGPERPTGRVPVTTGKLSSQSSDSRAGAQAYGRRLLASLRLPPGARVVPWPAKPPAGLSPNTPAILTDTIDLRVLYRLGAPTGAVNDFLLAHRPGGLTLDANGSDSHFATVTSEFVSFAPRALPAGIYSAELDATLKPAPGGGTLLRADAQVAWFPPRRGAVRIHAADYKSVTVTRSRADGRDKRSRTVSGPRQVGKLVALYNRLHGAPDVITSCPASGTSTIEYQLTFHPADAAPSVVLSPTNCFGVGVTIDGHSEPDLYPATAVIAAASRTVR